jgi:Mn-dependent DtxR family transcriptional regulator
MPHHAPTYPRTRSPAEQSFLQRRRNVLRAIRNRNLTPAAKQVLVHLSLLSDDPFVLAERPNVAELARRLALAERTVRQAVAELIEQGCLTLRPTGESAPKDDEQAFLAEARRPMSFAEHIDMLHHLRDRAVAAGRIATAVQAERAIGRALGLARRPAPPPREPTEYEKIPRDERKRYVFDTAIADVPRVYAAHPHFGPLLRRFADQAETLIRENRAAAAARDATGNAAP